MAPKANSANASHTHRGDDSLALLIAIRLPRTGDWISVRIPSTAIVVFKQSGCQLERIDSVRMTHDVSRNALSGHPWHGDCFVSIERGEIVDAQVIGQVILPTSANAKARNTGYATQPPLQRFLTRCHAEFRADDSGAVADY